jgi:hypothetical protein
VGATRTNIGLWVLIGRPAHLVILGDLNFGTFFIKS